MRIELDVELADKPGQLIRALDPISRLGGNIISVVHMREESTKGERVPVHIIINIEENETLEKILSEFEKRDIWVSKVGEAKKKVRVTAMLIGHVVDTDVRDTIDRLNKIQGTLVAELALSMPHPDQETSALMDIELSNPDMIKKVVFELEKIAGEKGLTVIKSLGV